LNPHPPVLPSIPPQTRTRAAGSAAAARRRGSAGASSSPCKAWRAPRCGRCGGCGRRSWGWWRTGGKLHRCRHALDARRTTEL